jgi:hypothetical protein
LAARVCSGSVICEKMMAGIGTIRKRNSHGNNNALRYCHPERKRMTPASRRIRDTLATNISAPRLPTTTSRSEPMMTGNPQVEGLTGNAASSFRFVHTMKAENSGTMKPWEKFGSSLHCSISRHTTL